MPINLIIRPTIPEHELKVLSRLRAEFDHKIENQEPLTHKEIIALGTNLWEALINSLDGGMDKLLALREQAIAEQTHLRLIIESDQPVMRALPWELSNFSQLYHMHGNDTMALDYLQKSLEIKREIGDRVGEAAALNNIAGILHAQGNDSAALDCLQESLSITKEIGELAGEATTLNNIACLYRAHNDYAMALDYSQKSLALRRAIGDRAGTISTLHNIANIHFENRQIKDASEKFTEALRLARETNNAIGLFNVSRDFGHLLCQVGKREHGLHLLRQAFEVGRYMGHSGLPKVEELLHEYS